jgi:integrase
MSVKVRPYVVATNHVEGCTRRRCGPRCKRVTEGWEVDIVLTLPDGAMYRERKKSPVSSKSGTKSWAEARAAELLKNGRKVPKPIVPTLAEFVPRYITGYCEANKQKPSTIESKKQTLDYRIVPLLGKKRLDEISEEDVQSLKSEMKDLKAKTINNVVCVLSKALKVAVKWKVIAVIPVHTEQLKTDAPVMEFYEFADYARLVEAAEKVDRRALLVVLLGGDAGLRTGEIIALEWSDVDFRRHFITVARSEWNGHVTLPKGGKKRRVPMTKKLEETLRNHRHLIGPRVLYRDDGVSTSKQTLTTWMTSAQKRAGLKVTGNKHQLRHTFCSHLAMKGATVIAIKELAGHRELGTTMKYMHLSPSHTGDAIKLLDQARDGEKFGDILETEQAATGSAAVGVGAQTPKTQKAPRVSSELPDLGTNQDL